ncbi:MAG: EscU/YscU/HrcU family type III secretion system export apparatus switch protein [Candidatus Eremiobacterota bacterium]
MEQNKKKLKAVAVKYDPDAEGAPRVISKGEGSFAEKIISIARKEGIRIHQDKEMVDFLSKVDINEEIPPELYEMVSNLLAFVYKLDGDRIISKNSDK